MRILKTTNKNREIKPFALTALTPLLMLFLVIVFFSIFANNFLTIINIVNVFRQVSILGTMAIGVTVVILLGEIDLSIATVMAYSGVVASGLALGEFFGWDPLPVWICIIIAIIAGSVIGLISGWANAILGVPGFMSTLTMLYVVEGIMLILTGAKPMYGLPQELTYFGSASLFGFFPVIIVVFGTIFIIGHILLKHTVFGRNLYAIGGNSEAARMSGIKVAKNKIAAFVFCSFLASIAGVLMIGRIGSGQVTAGAGLLLLPIAATVLGGTSLLGGKGTIAGTLIGVLIMGLLVNGLNLMGAGAEIQRLVTGIVLFIAVAFNIWSSKSNKQ